MLVEITWFWGLAGTLQGLLTPDHPILFPSYDWLEFYTDHIGVILAACWLVVGLGLHPRPRAALRVIASRVGVLRPGRGRGRADRGRLRLPAHPAPPGPARPARALALVHARGHRGGAALHPRRSTCPSGRSGAGRGAGSSAAAGPGGSASAVDPPPGRAGSHRHGRAPGPRGPSGADLLAGTPEAVEYCRAMAPAGLPRGVPSAALAAGSPAPSGAICATTPAPSRWPGTRTTPPPSGSALPSSGTGSPPPSPRRPRGPPAGALAAAAGHLLPRAVPPLTAELLTVATRAVAATPRPGRCSISAITASATCEVPTAVGSSRCGFMS